MKVYIVGGGSDYERMFKIHGWEIATHPMQCELIQFTGGSDVTPELYGEKNTYSRNDTRRDIIEAGYFAIAQRMGVPCAGICRGGQFLNVMCGGSMIQHIEGHATGKTHKLFDFFANKEVRVTSTHHQMMIEGEAGVFVAGANELSTDNGDAEVIWYKYQKCLCFQPHPEFGKDECQDYYFELLERYLGLKV